MHTASLLRPLPMWQQQVLPLSQQLSLPWLFPKNKKPRLSEVFFQGLRLVTAEHTVLRQREKYTRSKTNAQFRARILTFLSMDGIPVFVHKILFMHTVFIYTGGVRSARGGR